MNGFTTNAEQFVYNISQIQYNPDSLAKAEASGFLEADIALATLDTPTSNIPTWALLFSALPAPDSLDPVTGTGYHVNINGYGRTGSGTTGASQGIDWRRRAAENMLGALTSFDERNTFLFGAPFGNLPQNLYRLDFDDPNKSSPFDFNLYMDEPLEREATTAGGDSGGPLILDAANNAITSEDLVIGVLSGGSRFFGPQVFSSYGTESFFQPLYLFYDYIAATNPYRYVSAQAGDGNWEDGDHWITDLDPAYRIIDASGNIVNGFPDIAEQGVNGTGGDFGAVCFDTEGNNPGDECQNLADGTVFVGPRDGTSASTAAGTQTISSNIGRVSLNDLADADGLENINFAVATDAAAAPVPTAEAAVSAGTLPTATIANGRPGATGFVPDNIDPDVVANTRGRYFDVTLSADGATTLSSSVEIDKFTISGSGARLNIADGGTLSNLTDFSQFAGTVNVSSGGSIQSTGDYLLMNGLLMGSGTVKTPFLTSVQGAIAPGGLGTVGTLTIDGGLVLSSGSMLLVDIAGGASDLLHVTGDVSLGGAVALGFTEAPSFGDNYTFLTTDGSFATSADGVTTTTFDAVSSLGDGVLYAELEYLQNSVGVNIKAQSFESFLAGGSKTQLSYAAALNDARTSNYSQMSDLFGVIDFLDAASLKSALDAFAPDDAVLGGIGSVALSGALANRLDGRMKELRGGKRGFVTKAPANAIEVASADAMSAFSMAASQAAALASEDQEKSYDMKSGYGGFLNVDMYEGEANSAYSKSADIEGYTISAGLDRELENGAVLGAFVSYGSSDNSVPGNVSQAETDGTSLGLYAYLPLQDSVYLDGFVSYGAFNLDTSRTAIAGGTTFAVSGSTDATQTMIGVSIGRVFDLQGGTAQFTPSAGLTHLSMDIDGMTEKGSAIALDIASRNLESTQFSLGGDYDFDLTKSGAIRANLGGAFVYDAHADGEAIRGTFASAPGSAPILLSGADRDNSWFEASAGLDANLSEQIVGSLTVSQTINRDDLSMTVLGASIVAKF